MPERSGSDLAGMSARLYDGRGSDQSHERERVLPEKTRDYALTVLDSRGVQKFRLLNAGMCSTGMCLT
jgi:hypothetical protein